MVGKPYFSAGLGVDKSAFLQLMAAYGSILSSKL